ncbi:MAG: ribosome-associated translation inhibitor RaiA, partial [Waddliaceae bacterium]|nr:ribosome-associated translation inhibitor RaiA [Waddliaceae bacterium]
MNKKTTPPSEEYKITITGRHVHVTDAMKEYAKDKIAKIERFSKNLIDVVITMDIQKLEHRVDIVLKAGHVKIKVNAVSNDMYVSVDKAIDRLQTKLRKYKDRLHHHQTKALSAIDMNVNVIRPHDEDVDDINDAIEAETYSRLASEFSQHKIVKKEKRLLKSLSIDEAMMKMELSEDMFKIFRDEESNKLKVIYRRVDEDYG